MNQYNTPGQPQQPQQPQQQQPQQQQQQQQPPQGRYFDDAVLEEQQEFVNFVFEHGTVVDFEIAKCVLGQKKYHDEFFDAWRCQIDCKSNGNTGRVFLDIYIDGRLWDIEKNGKKWVQHKFLDFCKAVSLRPSKSKQPINNMWYRDPRCFLRKQGRVKLEYVANEGYEPRNEINWFMSPSHPQDEHNDMINKMIFNG